jgi:copper chaperone
MLEQRYEIDGMSCGHCVARVRAALEALPGVTVKEVAIGKATVEVDEATTAPAAIAAAIEDAGYDVLASGAR